ncbi:Oxysterol-binding protein-related protein 9 [Cryptotermes secundus]|uniref:Oxysterol-binding protein n=1 Tax=Cryptotermes secundus TaxID=105785 RepID=A0A2J7PVR0_9NEOP|nr:oxysterol-binding protein-related protein 9 isoform X3 [Cryptotermes secundus]PNF20427.1 Oxysterol-binding protein-related protein 9 [Cryptotermes secundus]
MASMEGSLSKWTNVMKGWQYRWFVLDDNAGLLSYYTSKEKMMRGVRRGCVRLKGAVIGIDDEDDSTFTITVDGKTFHFQARGADEREKWIRALEDTILRHAHRMRWDPNKPPPTVHEFDKKLVEADAYLQILIDQIKALEVRMDGMSDLAEKARCEVVRNHANDMLESIKHSIVMLQIAKNTAHPVNGVYQTPDTSPMSVDNTQAPRKDVQRQGLSAAGTSHRPSMNLIVPATSYSSSEEEDFYDANEYSDTPSSTTSPTIGLRPFVEPPSVEDSPENSAGQEQASSSVNKSRVSGTAAPPPVRDDGSLDYDALYEDESDHELDGLENHGSVVSHLISQVKIGMDLTKVVLPTFILERRSLLEMYADYFAHPDIFISIADFPDPKERMVQVVRWYMSAYHAGRKSTVAKKPYNPIIGEIFKCHWDIPGIPADSSSLVTDGPVPWCTRNQLTFVAEQVSHHPPISAFYAEHYNKRISFCAHVWTKSKFLGLSIGVHNIGQGCISVLDYDEEYIVTFPNGYGRSILTVPWIELGGSVTITCAKTGYSANVEFLTKPFYGGKKNRITTEVFQPNDKKPFLSITGEWNGRMEAKWADGRTEPFVDVNKIHVVKKKVRPIAEQTENESRKLWKEVTAGLRMKDIDRATNAKFALEQKQRDEAKDRKERGLKWETTMFQEAGENWVYKNPLIMRISPKNKPSNPH